MKDILFYLTPEEGATCAIVVRNATGQLAIKKGLFILKLNVL